MKRFFVFLFLTTSLIAYSQDSTAIKSQVRHSIDELVDFVAIPNDALNADDIDQNLRWLENKFSQRGFNSSILETENLPLFFAALPMDDNKPTILFYMHLDGQSVDPSKWNQENPYKTVLKSKEGVFKCYRPVKERWC